MEDKGKRGLRKGYTTGTCAAAACKAAATLFLTGEKVKEIQVTLPAGNVAALPVRMCAIEQDKAIASIIKDAGDDPDVTNGAEITAEVRSQESEVRSNKAFQFTIHDSRITVFGGKGIGIVTKPGLAISVGEPAINPVPRRMIEEAIREIFDFRFKIVNRQSSIAITLSVPDGEEIAKRTMNARLGIMGGISILGTTGIVEPLSLSAYRHSITCAMAVATAAGCEDIVFSTGRSSEKAAEQVLKLPEEAFILVGDHMGFALREAGAKGQGSRVKKIIIVGQFGKLGKLAAGHFETHCADSSIEMEFLAGLSQKAGAGRNIIEDIKNANTARQVFFILKEQGLEIVFKTICEMVSDNAKGIVSGRMEIGCMLIGYDGEIVEWV